MTARLTRNLAEAMDRIDQIPGLSGQEYGRQVHAEFAAIVRQGNYAGIGFFDIEQTFSLEPDARYGSTGSVRPDLVLRNDKGEIVAIYDVKTRGAVLRANRADELRLKTNAGPHVPVIELHSFRGSTLKTYSYCTLHNAD